MWEDFLNSDEVNAEPDITRPIVMWGWLEDPKPEDRHLRTEVHAQTTTVYLDDMLAANETVANQFTDPTRIYVLNDIVPEVAEYLDQFYKVSMCDIPIIEWWVAYHAGRRYPSFQFISGARDRRFNSSVVSMLRRTMPSVIANSIIGVQPMGMPSGQILPVNNGIAPAVVTPYSPKWLDSGISDFTNRIAPDYFYFSDETDAIQFRLEQILWRTDPTLRDEALA